MTGTDSAFADTDIAIVAGALRVPGADSLERFWQNLCDGVESVRMYSERALLDAGVSLRELSQPNYVRAGAPLEGMTLFDPEFFGFSPKEAAILDPQHRQFLEIAWEALERSGHIPARFPGAIGVFAGCGMGGYFAHNLLTQRELVESVGLFLLRHTGNDKDFLATRVSYCLDLRGPSVNVQTACSTSLVAVHLACQSLLSGECDLALAGGVTIEFPHGHGYLYHAGEILSPDGHCRPFDHRAQGTLFGSGAGVVVLRRLADARADGDPIMAVIKGSAVNNDGARKVSYLAPSVDGQAAAISEALGVANVSAESIGFVECHGTGTAMGDPIEIAALSQAFASSSERRGYCAIGSVKGNIGHLDTAAGVVALIKAALALQKQTLPPSIHYERPNPQLALEDSPFFVNDRLRPWPAGPTPRRAGVNSLGVGGTNAYVVLQEPPPTAAKPASTTPEPTRLLVLSARSRRALVEQQRRLAAHLREAPELRLDDVAYTLYQARAHFDLRRVLAVNSLAEAICALEEPDSRHVYTQQRRDRASLVMMFPGGGAQYPGMGAGLYATDAVYREHIDRGLALAKARFDLALGPLLFAERDLEQVARELERPSLQLPLLFIVEYALAQSWLARGVTPALLIGHSMGENTAACVAGVMDFETTLGLVALRGRLFESLPDGGMLSVPLSAAALEPLLPEAAVIACENGPELCVASGPRAALDLLGRTLAARGVETQPIRIRIAAHSPMLEPILADFGAYLRGAALAPPRIPIISNLTGALLSDRESTDPAYWVAHLRNTVRFARGIASAESEPGRVYLEVGPGRALGALVRQCLADPNANAPIASLRHADDDVSDATFAFAALGRLWASGVPVELGQGIPEHAERVLLPTYAFDHQPYFIAPGNHAAVSGSRSAAIEDWFFEPVWRPRPLLPEEHSARTEQTYLLFADDYGLANRLAERLQRRGHRCVFVRKGNAYGQTDLFEYEVAPHAPHSYATLLQELRASEKLPDQVLHLWSVDEAAPAEAPWAYDPARKRLGFDSLFHLLRACVTEGVNQPMRLTVATSEAQRVSTERLAKPEKALVSGICQVIAREAPNLRTRWVDLPGLVRARSMLRLGALENMTELVDCLELELLAERDGTIAYRQRQRFERELAPLPRTAAAPSRFEPRGVYLITGGLGGVGLSLARHLAGRYQARLVLLGRHSLPPRSEWPQLMAAGLEAEPVHSRIDAVLQLEALGAEVEVVRADVADEVAMRAAFAQAHARFGAVQGVLHAAGVLHDQLLAQQTLNDADMILRPKLEGTALLHGLAREAGVKWLALFSSTSSFLGAPGQLAYAAANAFLDAFAQSQRDQSPVTVALGWGVWRDVGMAAAAARALRDENKDQPTAIANPFFDARRSDSAGSVLLEANCTARGSWWLDDHRLLDGSAVMPGTGHMQLMAAGASVLGYAPPLELRDVGFLRPLVAADDHATSLRLRLRRSELGHTCEVQTRYVEAGEPKGYVTHATAQLVPLASPRPRPLDLQAMRARASRVERASGVAALHTSQERHLRFGPRFRCLRAAYYGADEALGELQLDGEFASDVAQSALHAGLLDIGTGFALGLVEGYAPEQGLWVPLAYRRLQLYAALPARCVAVVRCRSGQRANQPTLAFDVTLCDPDGAVCVVVEQLLLRRAPAGHSLAALEPPTPQELEPITCPPGPHAPVRTRTTAPAEAAFAANLAAGITALEGAAALELVLSGHVPSCLYVTPVAPRVLLQQLEAAVAPAASSGARFPRPELDTPYVAPTEPLHSELAELWQQLLGIDGIGIHDDFFALGGHSLTAVRLCAEVQKRFEVELGLAVLFEAPTIARLSLLVAETQPSAATELAHAEGSAKQRLRSFCPLVPIKPSGTQRPLFCVAGQGGNPMHLRTLAHHLGADRPFYGLQHRGLDNESKPYASVEEMAADFVHHITQRTPGPYVIAGYSGGGTAALEMARQLLAAGHAVDGVVLLDSLCPTVSDAGLGGRVRMHLQGFASEGVAYARRRVSLRIARGRTRLEQRLGLRRHDPKHGQRRSLFEAAVVNWRAIEARYRPLPLAAAAYLFRVHDPESERYFERRYNGWSELFTLGVESFIVPGGHVSMCEEPNVQILAQQLRGLLDRLDTTEDLTQLKRAKVAQTAPAKQR